MRRYTILRLFARCCLLSAGLAAWGLAPAQVSQNVISLPREASPASESSRPWVLWYWMQASFSKEGITADLEAMKQAGIGGAYLASIKGKADPPLYEPVTEQLTPRWWDMVRHALREADRLGLKIAILSGDGFATAGGPWITPELSMQKVVYSSTPVQGGKTFNDTLATPLSYKGYYRDIAILAFPVPSGRGISAEAAIPKVTASNGAEASFLAKKDNKQNFTSSEPCWIQYEFEKPFTCRSVRIHVNNFNYQSQRLIIEVSDDGKDFRQVGRLKPPRSGWLDWDADVTHSIAPVTARFFRFVYNSAGSEPGSEDLDAAKWKQTLKIAGIELSPVPVIHQFEGKTGAVWRISERTTGSQVPDSLCIPRNKIIDITGFLGSDGRLKWKVPAGKWIVLRVGHTSTGHMNETGGAGKGLECDKFNPEAVTLQFHKWFGEALRVAGPELAPRVLQAFYIDSWECGSQNWSPVFREEFRRRRGYDLLSWLPVMAGIPVESADLSERFLYDIRKTISELIADNFYGTLRRLIHEKGCTFVSETTAPVMTADGMRHFKEVDVPMGEFWLRSPSHDKPNDMLDAISGARIYGKPVVQAEAFTEIRMNWLEHPGNLKTLQDRNYALGINRLVYHVFAHNPWTDRKPGMTLSDIGLLFQRDQTWWKSGRAWVDYAQRCQALLQQGKPVTDIAVFSGEGIPGRAVLPDQLVPSLPGIFGPGRVAAEQKRLANEGLPLRQFPEGVTISANMATPDQWTDPLRGYAYDSFNADALLHDAVVRNGKVEFSGGNGYSILVLPGRRPTQPDSQLMSLPVAEKLLELVRAGATLVLGDRPAAAPDLESYPQKDKRLKEIAEEMWGGAFTQINGEDGPFFTKSIGTGRVIKGPFTASSFNMLGVPRDLVLAAPGDRSAGRMAWTHRSVGTEDIYFISNQDSIQKELVLSFRVKSGAPGLYDAVTGRSYIAAEWKHAGDRTELYCTFEPNASLFVLFRNKPDSEKLERGNQIKTTPAAKVSGPWTVTFDPAYGGPRQPVTFSRLTDWSKSADSLIRYYSGTAVYHNIFKWNKTGKDDKIWLDLGRVDNIAEVKVNGISCGVAWTAPYRVEITRALKQGMNDLVIEVTNTWANRLLGDLALPEGKRIARTTATIRIQGKPLAPAGLTGPVSLQVEE